MLIFLIDTENVGWAGVNGIEKLGSEDLVYVLYNKNFKIQNVKGEIVINIVESNAKCILEKVNIPGKNSLDFQLSCIVGRNIERYSNAKIIIVSNDNGYKAVIDYLNKNNRKGVMTTSINNYLNSLQDKNKVKKAK